MERTTHDKRWAGPLVIGTGALLLALGVALAIYSFSPHALYDLLTGIARRVTAHQPKFLTQDWVESREWPIRLVALVIAAAGAALIAFRSRATPRVGRGLTAVGASVTRLRREVPKRIRDEWRAASSLERAALAAVFVGAVAIRLVFLGDPMRYDETYTFQEFASQPFAVGISLYPDQNNHILNTVLAHFSIQLFGHEPWAIRLPAFLAGCAVTPAAYIAGRSLFKSRATALIGAALVATSSPLIEYSANARGYSFVVLAFLLLLALGRSLIQRDDPVLWALFALVTALGLWAVPSTLYAVATVGLWLAVETWLARRSLKALKGLVVALVAGGLLTLLLWSPVLAVGAPGLSNNQDYTSGLGTVVSDTWDNWTRDMPGVVAALLLAGFVAGIALHRRIATTRLTPLAPAAVVILLALAAGRLVQYPRTWLFLLPLFLLTAAAGLVWALERIPQRALAPAAALVLGVVLAVAGLTNPAIRQQDEGRDAPAMTTWLGAQLRAHGGHVVAITPFNYILRYYFVEHGLTADYVVAEVDPTVASAHIYVVVPGGKTLAQLTGDQAFGRGEGLSFQPIPGLKEALQGKAHVVRTYPTARIYTGG